MCIRDRGYAHPRIVRVIRRESARAIHISNLFHNPYPVSYTHLDGAACHLNRSSDRCRHSTILDFQYRANLFHLAFQYGSLPRRAQEIGIRRTQNDIPIRFLQVRSDAEISPNVQAVSYTHLDVYKRQDKGLKSKNSGSTTNGPMNSRKIRIGSDASQK